MTMAHVARYKFIKNRNDDRCVRGNSLMKGEQV